MLLSRIKVCSWCCSCLFLRYSPLYIGDDTQQHMESIMLEGVTLDVVCDVVVNFEHMQELQCTKISEPEEVGPVYICVCIISLSCALKIPRPLKVSVRCRFLPTFCWWSDQMLCQLSFIIEEHSMMLCELPVFKLCILLGVKRISLLMLGCLMPPVNVHSYSWSRKFWRLQVLRTVNDLSHCQTKPSTFCILSIFVAS